MHVPSNAKVLEDHQLAYDLVKMIMFLANWEHSKSCPLEQIIRECYFFLLSISFLLLKFSEYLLRLSYLVKFHFVLQLIHNILVFYNELSNFGQLSRSLQDAA